MSDYTIKVTYDELEEYAKESYEIIEKLSTVIEISDKMVKLVDTGYEGEAKVEMESYYNSFFSHMNRLVDFHSKVWQHILYIAQEMKFTDEQIGKLIAASLLNGEGAND